MERTGNITFSVIVPVYNVQAYLSACVKSVVEQAGPADWECILVDDGSTDACPAMCDAFAQLCPGVTVIHRSNGGLAAARNTGIKAAKGKWLLFLDSDDYWPPHMLENCALPYPPRRVTAGTSAAIWSRTKARGWMPSLIPARWSGSPPARMPTPITPPAWRGCMPQATGRSGAFVLTGNFWLSITCFSGMRSAGRRIIPLTWCWPVPAPSCITWMWSWWSTAPTGRAAC